MRMYSIKSHSRWINTSNNKVRSNVALVLEEVLLEHCHAGDDAGLAAGGQGVQLELGTDDGGGEFGVGCGTGAGAPNLGGDVVQLFAVLVGDDGAGGGSGVGGDLWNIVLACIVESRDTVSGHVLLLLPQTCIRRWWFLCWWLLAKAHLWRAGRHCECGWRSRSLA